MIPLLAIGLLFLVPAFVGSRPYGGNPTSTYVDKNGVTWTVYYDSTVSERWHASNRGEYGRDEINDVTSTLGTKQQAIAAVDFFAQEHKPVKK